MSAGAFRSNDYRINFVSCEHSTVEFCQKVFGAGALPKLTHKDPSGKVYAMVIQISGIQPMLEFWIGSDRAKAQAGYDFLTLAVKDRAALNTWLKHPNDLNIEHSDIVTAIDSWLLVLEDPDGDRMRFTRSKSTRSRTMFRPIVVGSSCHGVINPHGQRLRAMETVR